MSMKNFDEGLVLSNYEGMIPHLLPKPSHQYHKGQMGRICVIGGSLQYVGAAYYASMSSLKSGADLLYMVCPQKSVPILKAFSPEIMVIPHYLDQPDSADHIMKWMPRMHAILIGPGLGTDPLVQQNVISILDRLEEEDPNIPLVLDADALRILALKPLRFGKWKSPVYLTPNKKEQELLLTALYGEKEAKIRCMEEKDQELLGPEVTLVLKGKDDWIIGAGFNVPCKTRTSWRRCGGQGDLLAGTLATMAHYVQLKNSSSVWGGLGALAACSVVRKANSLAFEKKGRSMLVTDMLDHYHEALSAVFPSWNSGPAEEPTDN